MAKSLKNSQEALAKSMGFEFNPNDSCGGLPVLPPEERRKPPVYSDNCYICKDPEFAERGLPLCYACSKCGGHVAADDVECDDCGYDQRFDQRVDQEIDNA